MLLLALSAGGLFRPTPRASTGRHESTSAAHLLRPCCPPCGQTGKHKSSMPLLCWLGLGRTRTIGFSTERLKSTSAAQLLRLQRIQDALTVRHKSSMSPICWALLGQRLMLRGLTEWRKSTSVAKFIELRCPQVIATERHKPSMPPAYWLLSSFSSQLKSATVRLKSIKAADLLQPWGSPGSSTMQRKSHRAAELLIGVRALCFLFRVRCEQCKIPFGSSIPLRFVTEVVIDQSHCAKRAADPAKTGNLLLTHNLFVTRLVRVPK